LAQRSGVANGAGMEVCNLLLASVKNGRVGSSYTQWVVGYLSGYNLFGEQKQLEEIPDEVAMGTYLKRYCRDHPTDKVIWASMALINELGGYRPPYMNK
ncbi:MAG: hypothetical protein HXX19_19420, partial [Rhodoferax sp.]|nr:hypothetical protein [Rhodoferax sp.]